MHAVEALRARMVAAHASRSVADAVLLLVRVGLGATFIERHITLDRSMWGSDQAASVEVEGFRRLVAHIRDLELALGDGVKRVQPGEIPVRNKLRLVRSEREDARPFRASHERG